MSAKCVQYLFTDKHLISTQGRSKALAYRRVLEIVKHELNVLSETVAPGHIHLLITHH